jgi:predicted ATP-binding protein involved in virulence
VQLRKLSVENYRIFDKADFDFDDHLNLIVGWNGTGKSSLLLAIRTVLEPLLRQLGEFELGDFIDADDDVRFEMQAIGTRVRFEYRYPATLDALLNIDGELTRYKIQKLSSAVLSTGTPYDVESMMSAKVRQLDKDPAIVLPFFAFYGPKRNTTSSNASLQNAASEQLSRRDGYKRWSDALISAEDLQTWVIGKTLERLQITSEEGPGSELLVDDELDILNRTLEGSFPGLKGLRFDLRLRTLMLEIDDGRMLPFKSLSDGQRGFITLVADICRRMLILNPQLGTQTPQNTPGILMVDELDIHLHPDWQRRVVRTIRDRFPLLQIFATSHSPQMIGGLKPGEVLLLRHGKMSHPEATFGLDSSRILEDIMEAGSREAEVAEEIRMIFKDIEERKFEDARRRLNSLKSRAPSLPEYVRAEALIRRVEITGR